MPTCRRTPGTEVPTASGLEHLLAPAPPLEEMAPSAAPGPSVIYAQRCILLADWWLEKVDGEEGKVRVAGAAYIPPQMRKGNKKAGRVFRSAAIGKRHYHNAVETEDGYQIRIGRLLNMTRTHENGFSEEVCKCFEFGFPDQWLQILNPNKEQRNTEPLSESKVEYYMDKILREIDTRPMRDVFTDEMNIPENEFFSSTWYTSNAAPGGLYGGRTNMPEKPLTPPRETCNSGKESDQHRSMQTGASEQRIDNHSISSVSANQGTGSICHNLNVDDSILAPLVVSVEKVGHRNRVDCGQPEEDADIQHENMQICSNEQELVTYPIDSALANLNMNSTSSDLGEPGTQKCGIASVNLGTTDALELPTEKMNQQFGPVRGSEDTTVRRLRSGKVFGTPSTGPMKSNRKQKKIRHEASGQDMAPNEGGTSTADLMSHENDSSAAGVVTEDKQESLDSRSKRRGRPAKKTKRKSESSKLFWTWV